MKRAICAAMFALIVIGVAVSQSASDYFLIKAGTYYTLETRDSATGKQYLVENITIEKTAHGDFPGEILVLYRSVSSFSRISTVYSVTQDRVGIVLEQNSSGKENSYEPYPVIFRLTGQWKEKSADSTETYEYKAESGTCTVKGTFYPDCIVIAKRTIISGKDFGTEVFYYAKGIGCVYQKRIDPNGVTSNIQTSLKDYIIGSR